MASLHTFMSRAVVSKHTEEGCSCNSNVAVTFLTTITCFGGICNLLSVDDVFIIFVSML